MRIFTGLRTLILAAALSAPVMQIALADSASSTQNAAALSLQHDAAPLAIGGPYDNDANLAPPVGD